MRKYRNYYFFYIFSPLFFLVGGGGGGYLLISDFVKKNKQLSAEQSSRIHIGLTKVLQLWKINHGNGFVKLA